MRDSSSAPTAPRTRAHAKEAACGCAGIFSAHAGIELYAEIFDAEGMLPRLQGFASEYGADFYRLPRNQEQITLRARAVDGTGKLSVRRTAQLVPLRAGERIGWRLQGASA